MAMDYFKLPQAYPDETWYSLITRYHRKTGNYRYATSKQELFGEGNQLLGVNPLGVDQTIRLYYQEHGPTHGSIEECITRFTLAPYYLRYFTATRKKEIIEEYVDMEQKNIPRIFGSYDGGRKNAYLRFCPHCFTEDIAKYGEAYWHRSHQLWLADTCEKHGIPLQNSRVTVDYASYHLTCADENTCEKIDLNEMSKSNESILNLTAYANAALFAPFSFSEEPTVDALINGAIDNGYGSYKSSGFACKSMALQTDMCKVFPPASMAYNIAKECNSTTLSRIFNPRRDNRVEAALLIAAFFQLDREKLFEKSNRYQYILDVLHSCSTKGMAWDKSALAHFLGVKESLLPELARAAGVAPCWGKLNRDLAIRPYIRVSKDEYALMERRKKELFAYDMGEYIRYCIYKDIKEKR